MNVDYKNLTSNLFGLITTTLVAHGLMITSLNVTREFDARLFYVTSLYVISVYAFS